MASGAFNIKNFVTPTRKANPTQPQRNLKARPSGQGLKVAPSDSKQVRITFAFTFVKNVSYRILAIDF